MAMIAGTATMSVALSGQTLVGTYGGTGMAASFMAVRGARAISQLNAALTNALSTAPTGANTGSVVANILAAFLQSAQTTATGLVGSCEDDASAIVLYEQANAVAVAPANAFGSSIPPATVDLAIT
jgi:hypothetical protein